MEAFLQNPSLLLVDLIVAGICVGVVFLTKFNFVGATLDVIDKGAKQVVDKSARGIYDLAGSMFDSFTGQKHERLTYEEAKVEAKKRWDDIDNHPAGSTLADGRVVLDDRPDVMKGIDTALSPFVKWFTS